LKAPSSFIVSFRKRWVSERFLLVWMREGGSIHLVNIAQAIYIAAIQLFENQILADADVHSVT
jgi:hypothetical protein